MSDNDFLCLGLKRLWWDTFSQTAQWKSPASAIGYKTLKTLKKQVQRFGNHPFDYLFRCAEYFDLISRDYTARDNSSGYSIEGFSRIAMEFNGNKRAMSLAHDVAGQQFYALDQRQNLSIDNHRSQMTRNYFESVYFSMYEAPAKERENQLHAIPVREIWNHLDEIRPYVMSGIESFY